MKKIYMMLLALASVVMVQAEAPYLSEIEFSTKNGSPRISLKDSFNYGTEYITRRYVVYACDGETEILQMASFDESKSKGGSVSNYSVKDSTICKLYKGGVGNLRLYVAASYQTEKDGEFTPYLNENNDRTFYGEYTLPSVYSVSGYTMMSSFKENKVLYYNVFEKKNSAWMYFNTDSARLSTKVCAVDNVELQWQKREVKDVNDKTTPWSDFGSVESYTKADLVNGVDMSVDIPMNSEGGFRNQYWRLAMTIGDTTIYSAICDVFPQYPTILVGPIATSGFGNVSVAAGEKDTIWNSFESKIAFTGHSSAPCFNLPQADVECQSEVLGSGLTQLTQPGKKMTVTAKERTSVTLKFYDENKTTLLDTKTCNCGATAVPAEPQKEGYSFTEWVWMWASAYTWTTAKLQAASFNVDMNFFAAYEESTGFADIMATMPDDTKVYTILGQPVGEGYKGIVVVGGKKFLVQ